MNRFMPAPKAQKSLEIINAYLQGLNHADIDAMKEKLSPDFEQDMVYDDASGNSPHNRDFVLNFWKTWTRAFPGGVFEATRTIVAEEVVSVQWTFTGVHSETLLEPIAVPPLSPSGKTVSFRSVSFFEVNDNLIQKETTYLDLATVFVELGVHP